MNASASVAAIRDGAVQLGGRPVLRGIDLDVRDGDALVVLGANGSGKSTLVRTMLGLVPALRGEVELFGTPLSQFRGWRRIGFVPQRSSAASGVPATVREVVTSGRLSRRRPFWPLRATDKDAVDQAIHAVDLGGRADDGVATLSGGQQQRVLIARALAGEPDLLVLDEPTAGVDVQSQQSFGDAVRDLRARGTTVVVVAHELGPMSGLVDRAVVMREGRIAYDGAPIEAFTDLDHLDWSHGHHHPDLARPAADAVSRSPDFTAPFDAGRPKERP